MQQYIHKSTDEHKCRWRFLLLVALILVPILGSSLFPQQAGAKTAAEMNASELVKSEQYYNALRTCLSDASVPGGMGSTYGTSLENEDATSGNWFRSMNVSGGYSVGNSSESLNCSDSSWIKEAATLWGYSSPLDLLCNGVGAVRDYNQTCMGGDAPFSANPLANSGETIFDSKLSSFESAVTGKVGINPNSSLTEAAEYVKARNAFYNGCLGTANPTPWTAGGDAGIFYNVWTVDATGAASQQAFQSTSSQHASNDTLLNKRVTWDISDTLQDQSITCGELVGLMEQYHDAYSTYIEGGLASGASIGDLDSTYNGTGSATTASTCAVESIGWLVCPTVNFLSKIADNAFAFLSDSILKLEPGLVSTSSGTYKAWASMRNIANAAFIVFFIIIIYSQTTGAGITNYGLKKLLPKLIISAILVNISFFICQVAVDLSNIFGKNIGTIFDSIATPISQTPNDLFDSSANTGDGGFLGFAGIAISVLAAGAAVYFMLPFLFGAVLAAIVSLISVGFILVARKAIIVLLVAIAPLAFVAYLLPNTEALYKKWFKIFTSMLMLFPIVGLLFGAGRLASAVLHSVGGGQAMQIIASVANVIPLFATWTLLKGSMNALGGVGAKINSGTSKLSGMARKKGNDMTDKSRVGQFAKFRAAEREKERKLRQGGVYSGRNPYKKVTAALNRGFNNLPISGKFGDRANASALAFEKDEFEKDVKAAAETQEGMTANDYMALATAKEGAIVQTQKGKMRATREQKTAASDQIMANGSFDNRNALRLHNVKNGDTASLSRVIKQSYAKQDQNILGKDFGDKLLLGHYGKEGGITNEAELLKHAVENVQKGSLQPEHLVQSGGATSWLSGGIKASGNEEAENNFRSAAQAARNSQNTSKNIDSTTDKIFTNDWGIPK